MDLSPLSVHIGHLVLDDSASSPKPFPCLVLPDSNRVSAITLCIYFKPSYGTIPWYWDESISRKQRAWILQFEFKCVLWLVHFLTFDLTESQFLLYLPYCKCMESLMAYLHNRTLYQNKNIFLGNASCLVNLKKKKRSHSLASKWGHFK